MPYVRLMVDQQRVSREVGKDLPDVLRTAIAKALAVPDSAAFPAEEVTIDSVPMNVGPGSLDRMECDVQVLILSNSFPERAAIRNEIANQINHAVATRLPPGQSCWTWVCLQEAGFAKSQGMSLRRAITG